MSKIILVLLSLAGMMTISSCYQPSLEKNLSSQSELDEVSPFMINHDISPSGKKKSAPLQNELYTNQAISAAHFPEITEPLLTALEQQKKLLKHKKRKTPQKVGNLIVSNEQLQKTADILLNAKDNDLAEIIHQLDAHKIKGQDQRGNVHFTGYYTPVLPVSSLQSKEFPYPIYTFPKDWQKTLPSRKEIDGI